MMNLELALENIREESNTCKARFSNNDYYLTGINAFDSFLGGFSPDKKYLIIGQHGSCPLLFCNTIIHNISILYKKSFKEIASFIKPQLLDLDAENQLTLDYLDETTQNKFDVIISVYRPSYFPVNAKKEKKSKQKQLLFVIIKGTNSILDTCVLKVDLKKKLISSDYTANYRIKNEELMNTYNYNNFEAFASQYIVQTPLSELDKELYLHFQETHPEKFNKANEHDAQVVYLKEPKPILVTYTENPDQVQFVNYLKPSLQFLNIKLQTILNLITLYASSTDFEYYYNNDDAIISTSVIENLTQHTAHKIVYKSQLKQIIEAYTNKKDNDLDNLVEEFQNKNKKTIKSMKGILTESGLNLYDQLNQLMLPSGVLYTANYYTAQKIFNLIKK